MGESSWVDCLDKGSSRVVSPDFGRASSLVETANERIALVSVINVRNCNFVFEDFYTSAIELLQAVTFRNGFNILNHLCLGFYLRDVLLREDLFLIFDDLRYKRNSLTYYGSRMDFVLAVESIDKCKLLIKEIESFLG